MKKDYFDLAMIAILLFILACLFVSCMSYHEAQKLEDYRRFVNYMEQTNEPFEVACETDLYTERLQKDFEE